jgi:hypothetical protein
MGYKSNRICAPHIFPLHYSNSDFPMLQPCNNNQTNTLCFFWHLELHNQLNTGCVCASPEIALYVFLIEKVAFPQIYVQTSFSSDSNKVFNFRTWWHILLKRGLRHRQLENDMQIINPFSLFQCDMLPDCIWVKFSCMVISYSVFPHVLPEKGCGIAFYFQQ